MDLVTMSEKEVNRLEVIQRVAEKRLKQKAAAEHLGAVVVQRGEGERAD